MMGRGSPLVAGALLTAFVCQALLASRLKSPSFDEPAHIYAGFSYLENRRVEANLQHPPLLKEISALPLRFLDIDWPDLGELRDDTAAGTVLIGADRERVLFWSRLPLVFVGALLGAVLYL